MQKSSRKLFSYESKIDLQGPSWKLGIDIPLHGEELIDLQFVAGEIVIKGSFAEKLAKFSSKDKKLWLDMIEMLKHFLLSLKNPATVGKEVKLKNANEYRLFTYQIEKSRMTLKLYGEVTSDSEVNKAEFQYFPTGMSEKSALSLLLFTSECQNVLKMK